ncbi:GTPase binding protein Rid1 [Schizosaccharomyces cryophilus OY26]|uniref:GTPase binding protein Rid1 n=1 Tax=Schizosaccharomyces cryophilus (strain OY26 / ATCC MYA-4695 / CBS 11777 / NBRC 106824 / NRRL Y48691) TaxID=653667 RepID=S9VN71_SCHCR|nr:GTPase binding protein Rid1 [Schizosaccharomyces cryophilus OY26]EPY49383.1 GTPase binding protein Rid1 [Schizosaccharomyces cryophilus OY26]
MNTLRSFRRFLGSSSEGSDRNSNSTLTLERESESLSQMSLTTSEESSPQCFEDLIKAQVLSTEASRSLLSLNDNLKLEILNSLNQSNKKKRSRILSWKKKKPSYSEPIDFISYIVNTRIESMDETIIHKLALLLRKEQILWVACFIHDGGFGVIFCTVEKISRIEWRESLHDALLDQFLLCLKAMCTVQLGLECLLRSSYRVQELVQLLFSKKQPSDFATREVIIQIIILYLKAHSNKEVGAKKVFSFLEDSEEELEEVDFMKEARVKRPYRRWIIELEYVAKNVFWVWNHDKNIVELEPNLDELYDPPLGFIEGIETEATSYVASHIQLANELLASLNKRDRMRKRLELQFSGLERIMALRFRKSSQKFHKKLHDSLREWVKAARADKWPFKFVQMGST